MVYALVDSLVLESGYSSIRLESFLFTQQAFDDVRARLKPDGTFVVYNFMRQGWLVGRISRTMQTTFGAPPIVMSEPFVASIQPSDPQSNRFTCFVAGADTSARAAIAAKFAESGNFWMYKTVTPNRTGLNGFSPQPPVSASAPLQDWLRFAPAQVSTEGIRRLATDDWPFPYLRDPLIPWLNIREMILLAMVSAAILWAFSPVKGVRPNGPMFFLGAGFMLLETKGALSTSLPALWFHVDCELGGLLRHLAADSRRQPFVRLVGPMRLWPCYLCSWPRWSRTLLCP